MAINNKRTKNLEGTRQSTYLYNGNLAGAETNITRAYVHTTLPKTVSSKTFQTTLTIFK